MFKQFLSSKTKNLFEENDPKIQETEIPNFKEKSITKIASEHSLEIAGFARKYLIRTTEVDTPFQQFSLLTKNENSSTNIGTALISITPKVEEDPIKFKKFKLFLRHRNVKKCKYCPSSPLTTVIHLRLELQILHKYSIKDEFYNMKSVNDILFNNQSDEPQPGQNLQKCLGKMLTAIFKDYLIYDDIYEFMEKYYKTKNSQEFIKKYAINQNNTAVVKYGYSKVQSLHENTVNRANYVIFDKKHQKILHNNIRLKYLMKYEKRVQERDKQKKINQKLQEHIKENTSPLNTLNKYKKIVKPTLQKSYYESLIHDSMVQQYSSVVRDNRLFDEETNIKTAKNSTIFSQIMDLNAEILKNGTPEQDDNIHKKFKQTLDNIFYSAPIENQSVSVDQSAIQILSQNKDSQKQTAIKNKRLNGDICEVLDFKKNYNPSERKQKAILDIIKSQKEKKHHLPEIDHKSRMSSIQKSNSVANLEKFPLATEYLSGEKKSRNSKLPILSYSATQKNYVALSHHLVAYSQKSENGQQKRAIFSNISPQVLKNIMEFRSKSSQSNSRNKAQKLVIPYLQTQKTIPKPKIEKPKKAVTIKQPQLIKIQEKIQILNKQKIGNNKKNIFGVLPKIENCPLKFKNEYYKNNFKLTTEDNNAYFKYN